MLRRWTCENVEDRTLWNKDTFMLLYAAFLQSLLLSSMSLCISFSPFWRPVGFAHKLLSEVGKQCQPFWFLVAYVISGTQLWRATHISIYIYIWPSQRAGLFFHTDTAIASYRHSDQQALNTHQATGFQTGRPWTHTKLQTFRPAGPEHTPSYRLSDQQALNTREATGFQTGRPWTHAKLQAFRPTGPEHTPLDCSSTDTASPNHTLSDQQALNTHLWTVLPQTPPVQTTHSTFWPCFCSAWFVQNKKHQNSHQSKRQLTHQMPCSSAKELLRTINRSSVHLKKIAKHNKPLFFTTSTPSDYMQENSSKLLQGL